MKYNLHFILFMSFSLFSGVFMLFSLWFSFFDKMVLIEWKFLNFSSFFISLPILMDFMSFSFSSVVFFISANVMLFSNIYMAGESYLARFLMITVFFITAMMLFIFIPHLMCLLLGWDGLGLVSFLLVIYFENSGALGAGMLTALMNRVGDALIIFCISVFFYEGHWLILNFSLFNSMNMKSEVLLMVSLMAAAMTKSAQVPFSSWLPAAMAAPTPISALVHSSTLVTAGVYLLIRLHSFLSMSNIYMNMILIISSLTLMMS